MAGLGIGTVWASLPATGLRVVGGMAPALAASAGLRTEFDLATATADTFRPHTRSRFRVTRPGGKVADLVLADVTAAAGGGSTDTFSLRFTAAKPHGLRQATYAVDHAVLGPFHLFLVPSGATGMTAVVSHLVS
jgi:hypothetical protein